MEYQDNIIVTKSFRLAIDIFDYAEKIRQRKLFTFCEQLFKSGTSIGANVREAQQAESIRDPEIEKLINDVRQISKLLGSIIRSSSEKLVISN